MRQLLDSGQYERVVEILHEAHAAIEQTGDGVLADTLSAAVQICQACNQCGAEVKWHRQACEAAGQRESELRQQLQTILDLISEQKGPAAGEERDRPPSSLPVDLSPLERKPLGSPERHGFWQRIQNLLGLGASCRPPQGATPEVSADAPIPSFVEKIQPLAASLPAPEEMPAPASAAEKEAKAKKGPPSLAIYCLGSFRVYQDDKRIADWPSGKGKAIFKYMVAHRDRPVAKDILMDLFWRGVNPEAARNNLNVAIYGLRQAFRTIQPDFPHILFQDDHYLLNPAMTVWVDAEQFVLHYEAGRRFERSAKSDEAVQEYEIAEGLYAGDFLADDLYEDWAMLQREALKDNYLVILERLSRYHLEQHRHAMCIQLCRKMLSEDACREDAHRRLMRCYGQQGQRNLALRQYHLCVETLERVLDVPPMQATVALYRGIRNGETA